MWFWSRVYPLPSSPPTLPPFLPSFPPTLPPSLSLLPPPPLQIPGMLEFQPAREFLALDDQRAALPIYDQETIDEHPEPKRRSDGEEASGEGHMDLGGTEKETASITDFDLLKVIGKGSFGKVSFAFVNHMTCNNVWPL